MGKFYLKAAFAAAFALFSMGGATQSNAQSTVIYGRALTADATNGFTAWSESDVATTGTSTGVWIGSFTIDATNGLYCSGTGARSSVMTFAHTGNSIQTFDIVFNNTGNTGNSANYSYLKIGSDIEIQSNQQNQTGTVKINGTDYSISDCNKKNYNRGGDQWTIHIEINTATNILNSLTIEGTEGTYGKTSKHANFTLSEAKALSSSATYNTVTIGFTRSGGTPSAGLLSIKIAEEEQQVDEADYTINYKFGTETVKTVTDKAAVTSTVSAESVITVDGTKYLVSATETPSLTINSDATQNVLNVDVRKPYTATLKITTTVNGESTTETTDLTETDNKVTTWTYVYPLYKKSGDVYYKADNSSSFGETGTFADGDVIEKTVNYSTADNDVVFYGEAESAAGTNIAYSNGGVAGSTNYSLGTLEAGSYDIIVNVTDNSRNRYVNVREANSTDIIVGTNDKGVQELLLTLAESKSLYIGGYTQSSGKVNQSNDFDYVVVKKIATPSVTINTTSSLASYSNASAVTVSDPDVVIYKASAPADGTVTLTKVNETVIPAGTGVILYKKGGGNVTLAYGGALTNSDAYSGNALTGTGSAAYTVQESDNIYALVAGEQAVAKVNADVVIPAGKAYMAVTSGAKKLNIVFEGTVTGIDSVEAANADADAPAYNLAGQRVGKSYKGVVVKNGRKYIVK